MNEEAYINGFCKTAEAYGVDPQALAVFMISVDEDMQKQAFSPKHFEFAKNLGKQMGKIRLARMAKKTAPAAQKSVASGARSASSQAAAAENAAASAIGQEAAAANIASEAAKSGTKGDFLKRIVERASGLAGTAAGKWDKLPAWGKITALTGTGLAGGAGAALMMGGKDNKSNVPAEVTTPTPVKPSTPPVQTSNGGFGWDGVRQILDNAGSWYNSLNPMAQTAVSTGIGTLGGSLVGGLLGDAERGALLGALAGGGYGLYNQTAKQQADLKSLIAQLSREMKRKANV